MVEQDKQSTVQTHIKNMFRDLRHGQRSIVDFGYGYRRKVTRKGIIRQRDGVNAENDMSREQIHAFFRVKQVTSSLPVRSPVRTAEE